MSDILIRGIEKPKNIFDCHIDVTYCKVKHDCFILGSGRHPSCPLVEIPSHGRLIDGDALMERMLDLRRHGYVFDEVGIVGLFGITPTVLEATE